MPSAGTFPAAIAAGRRGSPLPRGLSLVELLVVVAIILVLMAMAGAAISAARGSQRVQSTRALIAKLDAIISQQYAGYGSLDLPEGSSESRGSDLRQRVSRDLPDRWTDVMQMAMNPSDLTSLHQRAYVAVWNSFPAPQRDPSSPTYVGRRFGGAECLFMIVMRGGIADCIDCTALSAERIGDLDKDGAFEFHDRWGNPIGYILWPGALELPADSGKAFFSQAAPFSNSMTAGDMRPLIYSAGPDGLEDTPARTVQDQPFGWFGFRCDDEQSNLAAGARCGDAAFPPARAFGSPLAGAADNLTNFDAEARR